VCVAPWDQLQQFGVTACIPLMMLGQLALLTAVKFVYVTMRSGRVWTEEDTSEAFRTLSALVLFSYTHIAGVVVPFFDCQQVGPHRIMVSRPAIDCDGAGYTSTLALVVLLLLVPIIAVPIGLPLILRRRRQDIRLIVSLVFRKILGQETNKVVQYSHGGFGGLHRVLSQQVQYSGFSYRLGIFFEAYRQASVTASVARRATLSAAGPSTPPGHTRADRSRPVRAPGLVGHARFVRDWLLWSTPRLDVLLYWSHTHSLTHSRTHAQPHSLTHALTHALAHAGKPWCCCAASPSSWSGPLNPTCPLVV
jgi:hypothetical protein